MRRVAAAVLLLHGLVYGVVSVAPVEPNEKSGFSGEADGAFKESSGNTRRKDYSGGVKFQYDYADRTDFILGNALYAESEGEPVEDNSFVHFRHLELLNGRFVWEVYAQQEQNDFINLTRRQLLGTGGRYRFFRTESAKFYFGAGAYGSTEEYGQNGTADAREYKNRGNLYLSYAHKEKQAFEATATLYYQPALDEGSDYYLLANGNLKFFLTEKLHLKFSFGVREDSEPFEANKKSDRHYVLGFGYTF